MPTENRNQEGVEPWGTYKEPRIGKVTEILEEVRKLTDSSEIIEREGTEYQVVEKGNPMKLLDTIRNSPPEWNSVIFGTTRKGEFQSGMKRKEEGLYIGSRFL